MVRVSHYITAPGRKYGAKPFLKWAGGKRQLIAKIQEFIPASFNTYFEPFVGGGAVLFDLQPTQVVINDRNAELINCYRVIKDSVEALITQLELHKAQNTKDYYYQIRQLDRQSSFSLEHDNIARAARIIYLNKTCYNGLFRVNSRGQFNVPFGKYAAPAIVEPEVLRAVSAYLNQNQVTIVNTDFADALAQARSGDFVYFDPPYDPVSDTASFTKYGASGFGREEQTRLREVFGQLDRCGCKLLLSNAQTEFIQELYQGFSCAVVSATRSINSNTKKRGRINEVLISNFEI
ncbi:DNA adenine methylase [Thalassoporum mexicanum PCC 7367]|uniref:DNA adenine methylase n=1 Tax=Thalassoporum mexicanum TaxID=3457544 RepID=UPI00029F927D|nr:DNA adenine methylase [Pseudanabaena sp. PCC 7367]AFY70151.1 DNA adenine methylase [Pseudanabaena sp. PCC 7367]